VTDVSPIIASIVTIVVESSYTASPGARRAFSMNFTDHIN